MITIELNDHTADDVKCIEELRSMGLPDDVIQRIYNESLAREKEIIHKPFPTGDCK